MKSALHLLILTVIIMLASCQKELDPSILNGPQDSVLAKLLLRHIHYIGDSLLYPPVTYEYGYDQQDRCNHIRVLQFDTATRDTVVAYELLIQYNGNNSNPNKVLMEIYNDQYTWFLFYDGAGKKIKDSIIEEFGQRNDYVVNYSYNSNVIYIQGRSIAQDSLVREFDTVYLQQDGVRQWNWQYYLGSLASRPSISTYTYDTKINPYNKFNISSSVFFSINYLWPFDIGLNEHNQVSIRINQPPDPERHITVTYEYDSDNYPIRDEYFDPDISFQITTRYIYTR